MAATQQNDFLTLVSYSTLNTFGGLSRTVNALPSWNLTISRLQTASDSQKILQVQPFENLKSHISAKWKAIPSE